MELLMVMVVLVVVTALVAPRLSGVSPGHSANDTARQILALTQYAQSQAIAEGRPYRLNIDTSKMQFWLTVQSTAGAQYDAPSRVGFREPMTAGTGVARISLKLDNPAQNDGTYIQFLPSGRIDPPVSITLTDTKGHDLVVACETPTEPFRILGATP
jgi:Tfp pilus assembly protein FimT